MPPSSPLARASCSPARSSPRSSSPRAAASASPAASSPPPPCSGSRSSTLGVGVVTLAETRIDSSIAAMIAGSVPLQVIVLRTLARERVALATRLSVLAGLAGLALIVVPGGEGASSAVGLALMLGASVSWSLGSFFGHRLPLPQDGFVATTWEMLSAGVFLLVLGASAGARRGRPGRLQPRVRRRVALPRRLRLARRVHRVRVAAPERADLEGRHASVRQPGRRDRARRAPARRAADAVGRGRRGPDRRLGVRGRAAGEQAAAGAGAGGRARGRPDLYQVAGDAPRRTSSRRGRGFTDWAPLLGLGRCGPDEDRRHRGPLDEPVAEVQPLAACRERTCRDDASGNDAWLEATSS